MIVDANRVRLGGDFLLQRLFSTFTNGWPGKGLLILRLVVFAFLVHDALRVAWGSDRLEPKALELIAGALGIFLVLGLWTPITASLAALVELWIAASRAGELWAYIMAASIACSLAMLGPGAWSMDAHYFGRKRISIPNR